MSSKLAYLAKIGATKSTESSAAPVADVKKKRKRSTHLGSTLQVGDLRIIDEDSTMEVVKGGRRSLYESEDAPVVANVTEERAKYRSEGRWAPIGSDSPPRRRADESPPRRRAVSPDASPPRRQADASPPRRRAASPDASPPRRRADASPPRRRAASPDASPPRRQADASPPRRRAASPDASPPRRQADASPPRRRAASPDASPPRRHADASPPRRHADASPPRRHADASPPRRRADASPPRRRADASPPRRRADASPPRRNADTSTNHQPTTAAIVVKGSDRAKMESGATAGLHSGSSLRAEQEELRKRELARVAASDATMMGKGAKTVYRGKDGRIIDMESEVAKAAEEERLKQMVKAAEKYEWSVGKVQKEQRQQQAAEMEKIAAAPFARYADDAELNAEAKSRAREDDPMAVFLAAKEATASSRSGTRVHKRQRMCPNRFNIPAGYRWDGEDRGNGFEGRLMAKQAYAAASQEEDFMNSVAGW